MTADPRARRTPTAALVALILGLPFATAPAGAGEAPAASTPAVIEWHLPGDEAAAVAAREGKPILYFFTAEWCAPCHHLKRSVFADPEKASHIAASYVPVEVQDTRVETGKNHPEVDEAIRRYGVSSLPTMVVALPDGEVIAQHRGYGGATKAWVWLQMQARIAEQEMDDE